MLELTKQQSKGTFMKVLFLSFLVWSSIYAYNLGTIATASPTGMYYKLGSDISTLLKKYDIELTPITTGGSYENLDILNGHMVTDKDTFFAIVQKDTISYYNYIQYTATNKSIYHKIPAILSLGIEQIHIITLEGNEYDFENQKDFNVYCGDQNGGSCVSAQYIEQAYGFNFTYINSNFETLQDKLKDGVVDFVISVIEAPAQKFQNFEGVKLIDLPTNFVMEEMYTNSTIQKEDYPFLDEDIHAFAVSKVLITNLNEEKYAPVIENIVKIIMLNKPLLIKEQGKHWENIDFYYTNYKKMSSHAKKVINSISKYD